MTISRLIVHAGQHKTGSSAIQEALFTTDLRDSHYIHRGMPNSSLWMLQGFKDDLAEQPSFAHRNLSEKRVARTRSKARKELNDALLQVETTSAVLSAESISTFKQDELLSLKEYLDKYAANIELHLYVRPLKSRMESAFQEKLKHRFCDFSEKFVLDYRKSILILDATFGYTAVKIHKYDRSEFPNNSVVDHFLEQANLQWRGKTPQSTSNKGLSQEAVKLLFLYRKLHPQQAPGDQRLIARLSEVPGDPFRFHSDLFRSLLVKRNRSTDWFEERSGFSVCEDVNAFDDTGIRSEDDLCRLSPATIEWLNEELDLGWIRKLSTSTSPKRLVKNLAKLASQKSDNNQ